jgi:galactose-1-phosphate uridylyltransferase
VTHSKKKVRAVTIAFDAALEMASADSLAFYQLAPVIKKKKKVTFGKPVVIASISYYGSRDVTLRLAKPAKGPLRLVVSPGIIGIDGVAGTQGYSDDVS